MRFNSRNSHVFSAKLAQRIRLFEALGTSTHSVLDRLKSGQYIKWSDLYPKKTRKSKAGIAAHIDSLYNDAPGTLGRGELLIKYLIDKDVSHRTFTELGRSNSFYDILIEDKIYEVKQAGRTIVLGGFSSIAASEFRNNLLDICKQIISFCKSVESRGNSDNKIQVILKTADTLYDQAARSSVGEGFFMSLDQLMSEVIDYDLNKRELPSVSLYSELTVGDEVYRSQLTGDQLQVNPKTVATIKNVLFPHENLHMLSSAELHHEVFQGFGGDSHRWSVKSKKKAVEDAFNQMPDLQGVFLVDPLGARFVDIDEVKNFEFASIVRSRISLKVPKNYQRLS